MNKYIIFILAIVLCFTIGCQNREKITELGKLKAEFEIEQEIKALAIRYIESISKGDFDVLNELLAPDYAIYSPSGYPSPSSREKLIENYIAARDSFSKFDWSLEDIMAQKDKVICRIIIRGVFNGEIPNLPSNEQEFMFSLINGF